MARIIDYSTKTKPISGDYFLVDNDSSGTKKVPADDIVMKSDVDPTPTEGSSNTVSSGGVYTELTGLKEDLSKLDLSIIDGYLYLNGHWVNGNISAAGTISYSETYNYQIISNKTLIFDVSVHLKARSGYKFDLRTFSSPIISSSTQISSSGNVLEYTVPANTYFSLIVKWNVGTTPMSIIQGRIGVYVESYLDKSYADIFVLKEKMDVITPYFRSFKASDFANGNISSAGTPSDSSVYFYQIYSKIMQIFPDKVKIIIEDGYKIAVKYYSSSDMISANQISQTLNIFHEVEIPANQYFAIIVNYSPSDTSTAMSVSDALAHVYVHNVKEEVNTLEENVSDLTERVTSLENSDVQLPPYWSEYMTNKMYAILEKDALIGNEGDSFIFITDVHIPRNSLYSPKLIQYIMNYSSVDKVFCGGDVLDIDTGDNGKQAAIERLATWNNLMYSTNEIFIVGNHDDNNFNGANAENSISASEIYGLMVKRIERFYNTNGSTSYVVDNESQKTRYIVLDCENSGYANVLNWMKTKLTELETGWKVVILQHRYWGSNISDVSSVGTQLVNTINSVFSSLNCTIVAVIVGHTHVDNAIVEGTNNYPIIGVNCDTRDGSISGYNRTAGTINEQSFDVVHLDYTNRKIYMTRIGAGSDREISY